MHPCTHHTYCIVLYGYNYNTPSENSQWTRASVRSERNLLYWPIFEHVVENQTLVCVCVMISMAVLHIAPLVHCEHDQTEKEWERLGMHIIGTTCFIYTHSCVSVWSVVRDLQLLLCKCLCMHCMLCECCMSDVCVWIFQYGCCVCMYMWFELNITADPPYSPFILCFSSTTSDQNVCWR